MTEDIEELRFQKKAVLNDLSCADEKLVVKIEQNFKHNLDVANKLNVRNTELKQESETVKLKYTEIRNNIPPESIEAVQAERLNIRAGNIRKTREALQETYGRKYSEDIFKEAETTVNDELGEKPVKQSVLRQLQQKQRKTEPNRNTQKKNHEYER